MQVLTLLGPLKNDLFWEPFWEPFFKTEQTGPSFLGDRFRKWADRPEGLQNHSKNHAFWGSFSYDTLWKVLLFKVLDQIWRFWGPRSRFWRENRTFWTKNHEIWEKNGHFGARARKRAPKTESQHRGMSVRKGRDHQKHEKKQEKWVKMSYFMKYYRKRVPKTEHQCGDSRAQTEQNLQKWSKIAPKWEKNGHFYEHKRAGGPREGPGGTLVSSTLAPDRRQHVLAHEKIAIF